MVRLAAVDRDPGGRQQLLAGAETTVAKDALGQVMAEDGGGGRDRKLNCFDADSKGHQGSPLPETQKCMGGGGYQVEPHMMVVLSSSISSRSLRASSCICILSCCSLVMYSMVFCSVMAWLVWGGSRT